LCSLLFFPCFTRLSVLRFYIPPVRAFVSFAAFRGTLSCHLARQPPCKRHLWCGLFCPQLVLKRAPFFTRFQAEGPPPPEWPYGRFFFFDPPQSPPPPIPSVFFGEPFPRRVFPACFLFFFAELSPNFPLPPACAFFTGCVRCSDPELSSHTILYFTRFPCLVVYSGFFSDLAFFQLVARIPPFNFGRVPDTPTFHLCCRCALFYPLVPRLHVFPPSWRLCAGGKLDVLLQNFFRDFQPPFFSLFLCAPFLSGFSSLLKFECSFLVWLFNSPPPFATFLVPPGAGGVNCLACFMACNHELFTSAATFFFPPLDFPASCGVVSSFFFFILEFFSSTYSLFFFSPPPPPPELLLPLVFFHAAVT